MAFDGLHAKAEVPPLMRVPAAATSWAPATHRFVNEAVVWD